MEVEFFSLSVRPDADDCEIYSLSICLLEIVTVGEVFDGDFLVVLKLVKRSAQTRRVTPN